MGDIILLGLDKKYIAKIDYSTSIFTIKYLISVSKYGRTREINKTLI
jgi:hypothetical protein